MKKLIICLVVFMNIFGFRYIVQNFVQNKIILIDGPGNEIWG